MSSGVTLCQNCVFWRQNTTGDDANDSVMSRRAYGRCCLNPPVVTVNQYGSQTTSWPDTFKDDGCGRGEPR